MTLAAIGRLNAHRAWANRQLLNALRELPGDALDRRFAIGHGTLRATLVHLQATEEVWFARLVYHRNLHLRDIPELRDLQELADHWDHADARWAESLKHLDREDLDKFVEGTTSRGEPFRMPMIDCLLHLYTTQTYHHAQANNMLRQLGRAPLDLSLMRFSQIEHLAEKSE